MDQGRYLGPALRHDALSLRFRVDRPNYRD